MTPPGTPMKAIVRDRYGPPDVLELAELARPTVGPGEVLVRLRAASLNQADLDYLYGRPMLTRIATGFRGPKHARLGLDAAGIVDAVGAGVTEFNAGDEVFGDLTQFGYGAFAEYACAAEAAWAHKPASMSFEEAATVPQSGILAMQNLRSGRKHVGPGHRVLINGASGNVGPFAVQIARALGAHVTGVCRTSKMDLVREAGADEVIDYTVTDYTRDGRRYDWILDIAGNHSLLEVRRALKPGGAYVLVGGPTRRILTAMVIGPLLSVAGDRSMGIQWGWKPFRQEDIATLAELIEAGHIHPVIDRRYELAQVPEALRYLERGEARGKIVVTIST
jgi:NADPH:quinone reductase-like Zn-dependent oxidoreductase